MTGDALARFGRILDDAQLVIAHWRFAIIFSDRKQADYIRPNRTRIITITRISPSPPDG